jgi:acyl carrier protein
VTRDEIVQAVRAFLRTEVLRDETAALAEDEPLISGGVVTSFDLVAISAFLEKRFGVTVPDAMVSREHLDTVARIASLVERLRGGATAPVPDAAARGAFDPIAACLPSFQRAPLLVVAAILAGLVLVELGARDWFERRGGLDALEGSDRRRMNYSHRDYEVALARHDLGRTAKAKDEVRIVFQGDSGTYGSFLSAEEACPAVMGRLLQEKDPGVRVYNVSYFGQSWVKDAEMLEAALAYKPDILVVSGSSTYLNRDRQDEWWLKLPTTMVYNRPLFRRFLASVPGGVARPEFQDIDAILAASEKRGGMAVEHRVRAVERHSVIAENHLLLQPLLLNVVRGLMPGQLAQSRAMGLDPRTLRVFKGKTTRDVDVDRPFPMDPRMAALLEAIFDRARDAGVEVAFLWEPEPTIQGSPPRRIPWTEETWRVIARTFTETTGRHSVPLVDCCDLLSQDEYLDSERHWTSDGNAAIGAQLAKALEPLVAKVRARKR